MLPCYATLRGRAWYWRSFWAVGGRLPVGRGLDPSWGFLTCKVSWSWSHQIEIWSMQLLYVRYHTGKKVNAIYEETWCWHDAKKATLFFFQNPSLSMSLSKTWDPNLCVKRSARTKSRYFFILMQSNKQVMLSFDRQGATGCHRCFGKPPFLLCRLHLFSLRRWTWGPLWWELCLVTQTAMAWQIRTTRSFF